MYNEAIFEHEWLGRTLHRIIKDDYRYPQQAKDLVIHILEKCAIREGKPYNPSIQRFYSYKTIEIVTREWLEAEARDCLLEKLERHLQNQY